MINVDSSVKQKESQPSTFDDSKPPGQNVNIFNQEIQDELTNMSQPQIIFSPQQDTVDIRSPKSSNHMVPRM